MNTSPTERLRKALAEALLRAHMEYHARGKDAHRRTAAVKEDIAFKYDLPEVEAGAAIAAAFDAALLFAASAKVPR